VISSTGRLIFFSRSKAAILCEEHDVHATCKMSHMYMHWGGRGGECTCCSAAVP
jgi:hypothetical protein